MDIQANEPQSGWDAQKQPKLRGYFVHNPKYIASYLRMSPETLSRLKKS